MPVNQCNYIESPSPEIPATARSAGSVYARAECEIPASPELATLKLWHSDSIGPVPASTHGCHVQKHSPGYPARRHEGTKKTPRAPVRARLPLLRFRPGGIGLGGATRGASLQFRRGCRTVPKPTAGMPLPVRGCDTHGKQVRFSVAVPPRGKRPARRIRLVAYGARLESVLGESPRGFESPILRQTHQHVG